MDVVLRKGIKIEKIIILLFSFLIIFSLNSVFVWSFLGKAIYVFSVVCLLSAVLFLTKKSPSQITKERVYLAIILSCVSLYLGWTWDTVHLGMLGPLNLTLVFCYLILNNRIQELIAQKFITIFTVILFITLLSWCINISLGIYSLPVSQPPTKVASLLTYQISILGEVFPANLTGIYRYQGVFDEPGLMGTLCALLLCSKIYKNKLQFFIILFAGLASMSTAFILILTIYLCFLKPFKAFVIYLPIGALMVFMTRDIPFLGYLVYTKINNLIFKGESNRVSDHAEKFIDLENNKLDAWRGIFGQGYGYVSSQKADISSWQVIWLDSGFLGLLLLLLAFICCAVVQRANISHSLPFFMAFIASFMQRPGVFNLFFIFVFCSAMYLCGSNRKSLLANPLARF
jgi:hypothetical protein